MPDYPTGMPVQDFIEASRILAYPYAQEAVTDQPPANAKPVPTKTAGRASLNTFGFGPGSKVLEVEEADGSGLVISKPRLQVDLPPSTVIPGWKNCQDGSKALSKSTAPSDEEIFAYLLQDCEPPPQFKPCAVPRKHQVNLDEYSLCVYPQVWDYIMTPSTQEQKDHANWKQKLEKEGKWDKIYPFEYLRHQMLPSTKSHFWEGMKVAIYDGMDLLEDCPDVCLQTWGANEEDAYSDAGDDDGSENDGDMVDTSQETLEEDLKWLIAKGKLPLGSTLEDAKKYKAVKSIATGGSSKKEKKKASTPPAPTGTDAQVTEATQPAATKAKKKRASTKRRKKVQLVKETQPKKTKKKVDNEDSDFDPDDADFPDFDAGDDDDDDQAPTKAKPKGKGKGKKKSASGKSKRRQAGEPPTSVENQLDHCVRDKFLGVKNLLQSVQIMSTPRTLSDYYVAPAQPSLEEKELELNESLFPRVIFGAYVLTAQKPNVSGSAPSSGPRLLIPKLHMWVGCEEYIKFFKKILKPLNNKKLELVLHGTFEDLYSGAFGHDPLDTKRKRKEVTPMLEQQAKGAKRKANTPPKTMTQMIDNFVREKLVGVKNPMLMAQKMSTPMTLSDEWATAKDGVQLSEEENTRKLNEHEFPFVSIGAFCFTELKGTNKKGGSNSSGQRLLVPKLHFWANSSHHAGKLRLFLKPMERPTSKATPVVHVQFDDFYSGIFGVAPLNMSRARKEVVQKVPSGAAAVKQEEAPVPIKVENVTMSVEEEGVDEFAVI